MGCTASFGLCAQFLLNNPWEKKQREDRDTGLKFKVPIEIKENSQLVLPGKNNLNLYHSFGAASLATTDTSNSQEPVKLVVKSDVSGCRFESRPGHAS